MQNSWKRNIGITSIQCFQRISMKSSLRVTVLGGGIIGLTSALTLLRDGFTKLTLIAKDFEEDTTTALSGNIPLSRLPFSWPLISCVIQTKADFAGAWFMDNFEPSCAGDKERMELTMSTLLKDVEEQESGAVCIRHGFVYFPTKKVPHSDFLMLLRFPRVFLRFRFSFKGKRTMVLKHSSYVRLGFRCKSSYTSWRKEWHRDCHSFHSSIKIHEVLTGRDRESRGEDC